LGFVIVSQFFCLPMASFLDFCNFGLEFYEFFVTLMGDCIYEVLDFGV